MKTLFAENPNPVFRETFINTLAEKGYDKDKLNQYAASLETPEAMLKTGADQGPGEPENESAGIPSEPLKEDKESLSYKATATIGKYIEDSAIAAGEGFEQAKKGVTTAFGTPTEKGDVVKGGLNAVAGAAKSAFAAGGIIIPELAAFNAGIGAVKSIPDEVKEFLTFPVPGKTTEDQAKTFDKIIDLPFTAATTMADKLGYNPEDGSSGKAALEILDLAGLVMLGHAAKSGKEIKIKDSEGLLSSINKMKEGKATEMELKDYNEFSESMQNVTLEELKAEAQKQGKTEIVEKIEDLPVKDNDLHTELASLQAAHDALPEGEAKSVLWQKIDFKEQEIAEKSKAEVDRNIEEAAKVAQTKSSIEDIDKRIKRAEIDRQAIPPGNKQANELLDKHIKGLEDQKKSLQEKPEVVEPVTPEPVTEEVVGTEKIPGETPVVEEVGISEEMRAKQREELGLPDLPPIDKNIEAHTFEALNKEANRVIESGEVDFRKLAEEVVNDNRVTTELDKAVLLRGATEMGKQIEVSKAEFDTAKANGDRVAEEAAQDKYLQSLSDLNNIHNALTIAGTEAGRNLAAMKQGMREDYSIGSLYTRFKKANRNKPLPKEMIDRLDNYAVQIKELETVIKDQESKLKKQGLDIENLKSRKPTTKEKIKEVREKRSKLFEEWKEARNAPSDVTKQGVGIGDKDVIFAGKIALSYLEEGYLTTMQVSKQLKKDVKEYLNIKLSDDDIAFILDQEIDGKKVVENFDHYDLTKKWEENKLKKAKLKKKVNEEQGAVELANKSTSDKIKEGVANVLNVPRSLMASFDFSAPLRQGLVASVSHPKLAAGAGKEMFKQAFSQKNFDEWLLKYKDTPDYKLAHNSELYIADPSDLHLTGKEEAFMSNLAEKIPVVGKAIKASERAYVGYLNKLRSDVFKQGVEQLEINGKTFEKNPEEYKALADYINSSTGRGKLPNKTIEDAAPLLNSLFFSPRLIASRVNLLNPVYYAKMPAQVRVKALTDMGKFAAFAATALTLAKLAGAEVETDGRSSDFAKIKIGDTRYDMLGGFQQYLRLGTQLVTGQKKSTNTGKIQDLNPMKFPYSSRGGQLASFTRSKLSPAAGIGMDFLTGRDAVGQEVTFMDEMYTHFSPLQLQGALESYEAGGMGKVWQTMIPSMFGIGVSTYSSGKTEEQLKKAFLKMANQ